MWLTQVFSIAEYNQTFTNVYNIKIIKIAIPGNTATVMEFRKDGKIT
jgi:hypothetical protein